MLVALAALPVAVAAYYVVRLTVCRSPPCSGPATAAGCTAARRPGHRSHRHRAVPGPVPAWSATDLLVTWTDRRKSKGRLGQVYVRGIPVDDSGDTIVSIARPDGWCQDDPRPDFIPVVGAVSERSTLAAAGRRSRPAPTPGRHPRRPAPGLPERSTQVAARASDHDRDDPRTVDPSTGRHGRHGTAYSVSWTLVRCARSGAAGTLR